MKLLFGYTLDYLKRNRRSSLAIMVAILMTCTMMSALIGFLYNIYTDNLRMVLQETGNWHGELFDTTTGSQLPILETFDSLESIMIKGNWKAAQIDDPRRDYLVWRDANTEYWNSMPEGSVAILEGRVPIRAGEIALSKQYFENHPKFALGDSLVLPMGNRIAPDGSMIEPQNTAQPGEAFAQTGTVTLTVVGKLDVATSSTVPAYTAIGFLEPGSILPEDDLTVYFRFHNMHDTYKELPRIAAALGYEQDEYGEYSLRYNTNYLTRKGVLSPEQIGLVPLLLANQMPLMFGVMGLMVVGLFVLIIHNAFALSSSARLTQLGIFASVGATPKQIKRSVVWEALLLTAIPLPIGLLLGQLAVGLYINFANRMALAVELEPMQFTVGWPSVLPAVLLTLLTVWWSALIPARKIARMSPIAAIRQGGAEKLKRPRRFSVTRLGGRLFGLPGELAANALQARKKSYRTATVSLTLSFMTLICLLSINSAGTASQEVYQTDQKAWAEQDIILTLYHVATPEDYGNIIKQVGGLEGIASAHWYNYLRTVAWVPEEGFSTAFEEKGGFAAVEKELFGMQVPLLRDGKRRVGITLLGLDDASFASYCATLGIDPAPFYESNEWRSILYHTVNDVGTSTKRNPVPIPFLDVMPGDTMTLTEAVNDSYEGNFTFDVEIAAIADQRPPIGNTSFGVRYSAIQVMPIEPMRRLAAQFAKSNIVRMDGIIRVSDPAEISAASAALERICESYFGSGDYRLYDENEYYEVEAAGKATTNLMFGFVVVLLAIIGLSNVWSTVRGTLNARRREFAMLRSVGLPPRGLKKMLLLEAVLLGLTPMILGLPVFIILQGLFLWMNEVSFVEWLPYAPWLSLLLYAAAVVAIMAAAYATGGRKLLSENIIEAIKVDSI